MYLGKFVEIADTEDLFDSPLHPYTQGLISAIPIPDPKMTKKEKSKLSGEVPSPINPPKGCRFAPRCKFAKEHKCMEKPQELIDKGNKHFVACIKVK
jgi:oligopeptide/dipeptide ABC transporter ATP-binding protein